MAMPVPTVHWCHRHWWHWRIWCLQSSSLRDHFNQLSGADPGYGSGYTMKNKKTSSFYIQCHLVWYRSKS